MKILFGVRRPQSPLSPREPQLARFSIKAATAVAALQIFVLAISVFAQAPLKVPDAQQFVGNPKGAPLTGEPLHRRTLEVSALLRCPVCQGLSVADSPSEMAVNMKAQVSELLARGYTEEQILQYFELSYGGFVLLRPKNPAVWMIPIVALLLGMAIVARKIRKLAALPPPTANRQLPTDEDLERVRKLVNGVKPGVKS